jgi:Uma2 family endonuclease
MSTASNPLPEAMTVAEFLAHEDTSPNRYELVDGVMVAMNPPHPRHADIVENVGRALESLLVPPCRVYRAEIGVAAGDRERNWREPDVVVTCVRPEAGYVRSPRLVVEVLSPSTEKDDRTTKLDFYETLPTLEAVLLVWQDERRVRLRSRGEAGWVDQDVIGSGTVPILELGVTLSLDEIYADPWGEETPGEA